MEKTFQPKGKAIDIISLNEISIVNAADLQSTLKKSDPYLKKLLLAFAAK
jgi:hypothetical protein